MSMTPSPAPEEMLNSSRGVRNVSSYGLSTRRSTMNQNHLMKLSNRKTGRTGPLKRVKQSHFLLDWCASSTVNRRAELECAGCQAALGGTLSARRTRGRFGRAGGINEPQLAGQTSPSLFLADVTLRPLLKNQR
jgi:hypothetical protein